MRLIVLILLLFALPVWATDTVLTDHDGVTQPLVLSPPNIGAATAAQGAKADTAVQASPFTYVVAPDTSWKADYYCTSYGGDCAAAVQAAINAASSGMAVIEFTPGYFMWHTAVTNSRSNITLKAPGEAASFYVDKPITAYTISSGTSSRTYGNRIYGMKWSVLTATSPTLSGNGSTVTVTTGAAHGYTTGDSIWVRGWTGGTGNWNGIYTITVTDATHFTYAATGNGTPTGGKVSYPATAISSVKSSQQYMVDSKFTDFSRAIHAESAWDHFRINTQIMECGAGNDYLTAAEVIRNSADGSRTAGYFVNQGRHETWLAGMGTQFLIDSTNGPTPSDTIRYANSKFEYYIDNPIFKTLGATHLQIVGNNFNGAVSPILNLDSATYKVLFEGNSIHTGDVTGRGRAVSYAVVSAANDLFITGNSFTDYPANSVARVHLTTAAKNSRITGNHQDSTTPWLLDDGATGTVAYGNTKEENLTESLLNLSDVTTADVSITKHGLTPKLPNDSTKFLNGIGGWSAPPGSPNNGTLASVGLSLPAAQFTVTGSPLTADGTITAAWASQLANLIFASPSGSNGVPSFRAMTAADLGTTMAAQFGTIGVNAANDASAKIYVWGSSGTAIRGNTSGGGTALKGDTATGYGVNGAATGAGTGVLGSTVGGTGVSGSDSAAGVGVNGSTQTGIAFNANGNYGKSLYAYQYKASMAQSNNNPVAHIQKNLGLNGYTSTGPVLFIENVDSTASTNYGPLIQAKKGSNVVFQVGEDGEATANQNLEPPKANGTCSTSINLDANYGKHTLTLSGACQIGVANLTAGEGFTLKLTQSSTVAPTFTSAFKWAGGTAPTFSTSATKYDKIVCDSDDGTTLDCAALVDVR